MTEPQAPKPTIEKSQLNVHKKWNERHFYEIKILFVDVSVGTKWARINVTNQIIDGDMPYIYRDDYKLLMKGLHIKFNNFIPLWNVLRKLLIADGLIDKFNDGAILIEPNQLKEYLTGKSFKVEGRNFYEYGNAIPTGSDAE